MLFRCVGYIQKLRYHLFPIKTKCELVHRKNPKTWSGDHSGVDIHEQSTLISHSLTKGWYILDALVNSDARVDTKFMISNHDANDIQVFSIPLKGLSRTKRVFYVKNNEATFSIDPICVNAECLVKAFTIRPLAKFRAFQLMKKKLSRRRGWGSDSFRLDESEIYLKYCQIFHASKDDYSAWIENIEKGSFCDLQEDIGLISIVMPVYNPNLKFLKMAVDSLLAQTYKNWELCIADDASSNLDVHRYLETVSGAHPQIKTVFRSQNGHISAATNSAIQIATGGYIVFMDQDDLLSPHCINEIAAIIIQNPSVKLIYSDEDKIDVDGVRYEPHFKPQFSPALLLGQNYISHFTAIKSDLVSKLAGLRVGFDGAQDHDLLIRALTYLNVGNVHHIPKVLYHWRAVAGSTALSPAEKSYTEESSLKSVKEYLEQKVVGAKVLKGRGPNTVKVEYPIDSDVLVSILVPTRDGLSVLKPCIESVLSLTKQVKFELLILNNDSCLRETIHYLNEIKNRDSRVRVIDCPGEFNYSNINNIGAKHAKGKVLVLLNNDIEIINENWLAELASSALREGIGCVGAKLLYPNGTIQHGGVVLGMGGVAGHSHLNKDKDDSGYFEKMNVVHEVSAVTGACLAIRKSTYLNVGGLDESLKVAFNDIDFCLRVSESGFRNLMNPYVELYHHESVSRGYEDTPAKVERFNNEVLFMKRRWGDKLKTDPYYNPNFDLRSESHRLRVC